MTKTKAKEDSLSKLASSYLEFDLELERVSGEVTAMVVDLPFDVKRGRKTYEFQQDEKVFLVGTEFDKTTGQFYFLCGAGTDTKPLPLKDAELIAVEYYDEDGIVQHESLESIANGAFARHVPRGLGFASLAALEKHVKENPKLSAVLNDSEAFMKKEEEDLKRESAYGMLDKFGQY